MSGSADHPWLSSYAEGVPARIEITDETLCDLLDASVDRFEDHVALDFFGATTSYRDLGEQVARAAGALRELGVGPGDRVALILPNCPQHIVAFYAVVRLGAIVVENNPLYTAEELTYQLADSGARLAIAWDKVVPTLEAVRDQTSLQQIVAVTMTTALPTMKRLALRLPVRKARTTRRAMTSPAPGALPWRKLITHAEPLPADHARPVASDVAVLQYTGGTTGTPKGAMLTHRNLRSNAAQGRAWVPGLVDGREVVYAVLPMFHAYGLTLCLTFSISIGATIVLFPRFDADQVLDAMERLPATFLPAVPPVYQSLAESAVRKNVDLHSIRYALSGAMSLPTPIVDRWESLTGGLLVEGYGMTETSPVALGNPIASTRRPGTVGVPFPSTDIRIVDPADPTQDVDDDDSGELLIRGPQVFAGYWNRPQETAQVLLAGGWIRTGDIVIMHPDGFVTIVDRIKELIITGGENVSPREVEEALYTRHEIEECAVIGLPDREYGERIVAYIIPRPGKQIDPISLKAYMKTQLSPFKVPKEFISVSELPKSSTGKLLKRELKRQVTENKKDEK